MEKTNDQWLWFVDNELVEALARTDTLDAASEKRPVQSPALVKALALNMDGKTEQALREIRAAIDSGDGRPELIWTRAHLEFQLGQFDKDVYKRQVIDIGGDNARTDNRQEDRDLITKLLEHAWSLLS